MMSCLSPRYLMIWVLVGMSTVLIVPCCSIYQLPLPLASAGLLDDMDVLEVEFPADVAGDWQKMQDYWNRNIINNYVEDTVNVNVNVKEGKNKTDSGSVSGPSETFNNVTFSTPAASNRSDDDSFKELNGLDQKQELENTTDNAKQTEEVNNKPFANINSTNQSVPEEKNTAKRDYLIKQNIHQLSKKKIQPMNNKHAASKVRSIGVDDGELITGKRYRSVKNSKNEDVIPTYVESPWEMFDGNDASHDAGGNNITGTKKIEQQIKDVGNDEDKDSELVESVKVGGDGDSANKTANIGDFELEPGNKPSDSDGVTAKNDIVMFHEKSNNGNGNNEQSGNLNLNQLNLPSYHKTGEKPAVFSNTRQQQNRTSSMGSNSSSSYLHSKKRHPCMPCLRKHFLANKIVKPGPYAGNLNVSNLTMALFNKSNIATARGKLFELLTVVFDSSLAKVENQFPNLQKDQIGFPFVVDVINQRPEMSSTQFPSMGWKDSTKQMNGVSTGQHKNVFGNGYQTNFNSKLHRHQMMNKKKEKWFDFMKWLTNGERAMQNSLANNNDQIILMEDKPNSREWYDFQSWLQAMQQHNAQFTQTLSPHDRRINQTNLGRGRDRNNQVKTHKNITESMHNFKTHAGKNTVFNNKSKSYLNKNKAGNNTSIVDNNLDNNNNVVLEQKGKPNIKVTHNISSQDNTSLVNNNYLDNSIVFEPKENSNIEIAHNISTLKNNNSGVDNFLTWLATQKEVEKTLGGNKDYVISQKSNADDWHKFTKWLESSEKTAENDKNRNIKNKTLDNKKNKPQSFNEKGSLNNGMDVTVTHKSKTYLNKNISGYNTSLVDNDLDNNIVFEAAHNISSQDKNLGVDNFLTWLATQKEVEKKLGGNKDYVISQQSKDDTEDWQKFTKWLESSEKTAENYKNRNMTNKTLDINKNKPQSFNEKGSLNNGLDVTVTHKSKNYLSNNTSLVDKNLDNSIVFEAAHNISSQDKNLGVDNFLTWLATQKGVEKTLGGNKDYVISQQSKEDADDWHKFTKWLESEKSAENDVPLVKNKNMKNTTLNIKKNKPQSLNKKGSLNNGLDVSVTHKNSGRKYDHSTPVFNGNTKYQFLNRNDAPLKTLKNREYYVKADFKPTNADRKFVVVESKPAIIDREYVMVQSKPEIKDEKYVMVQSKPVVKDTKYVMLQSRPSSENGRNSLVQSKPIIENSKYVMVQPEPNLKDSEYVKVVQSEPVLKDDGYYYVMAKNERNMKDGRFVMVDEYKPSTKSDGRYDYDVLVQQPKQEWSDPMTLLPLQQTTGQNETLIDDGERVVSVQDGNLDAHEWATFKEWLARDKK